MGLAGVPWPRAQSSSSEPHCTGAPWHRLRSQSQSRVQTAPSHNKCEMFGGIKAVSPWVKSASEKLPCLPTMLTTVLAPSGEDRTLEETAPCSFCCGY